MTQHRKIAPPVTRAPDAFDLVASALAPDDAEARAALDTLRHELRRAALAIEMAAELADVSARAIGRKQFEIDDLRKQLTAARAAGQECFRRAQTAEAQLDPAGPAARAAEGFVPADADPDAGGPLARLGRRWGWC